MIKRAAHAGDYILRLTAIIGAPDALNKLETRLDDGDQIVLIEHYGCLNRRCERSNCERKRCEFGKHEMSPLLSIP